MGVDELRLELNIGLPAHELKAKSAEDRAQMLLGNRRRDGPTRGTDDGSRFLPQELLPHGRAPQSIAFLSTAGIERLCSGVTKSRASVVATSDLNRATFSGTGCSRSWLYIGRSSSRINRTSKASLPSLARACASLRLMDSRRLLPTRTL